MRRGPRPLIPASVMSQPTVLGKPVNDSSLPGSAGPIRPALSRPEQSPSELLLSTGPVSAFIILSLPVPTLHCHGARRRDPAAGRTAHPRGAGPLPGLFLGNGATFLVVRPADVQGHGMQRLLAYLLRLEQEDRIVDRKCLIEVRQEGWAFYSSAGGIWRYFRSLRRHI
jgi:hypothetical protein